MGIVVDNPGSIRDSREEVNRAVLNLIRARNPQDEIFVVNFTQKYYLDQDFTSDVGRLETALTRCLLLAAPRSTMPLWLRRPLDE